MPVLGHVPAGGPFISDEDKSDTILVDPRDVKGRRLFALRVYGDSMVDAGILEGDLVIVDADADARDGDIVVARLGPETTVKRLSKTGSSWVLRPENRHYRRMPMKGEDCEIQGKVIALHRPRV